jgi:hypothetical protein
MGVPQTEMGRKTAESTRVPFMYAFNCAYCRRWIVPTDAATATTKQAWQTGCSERVAATACTKRTGGVGVLHASTQIVWMHSPVHNECAECASLYLYSWQDANTPLCRLSVRKQECKPQLARAGENDCNAKTVTYCQNCRTAHLNLQCTLIHLLRTSMMPPQLHHHTVHARAD